MDLYIYIGVYLYMYDMVETPKPDSLSTVQFYSFIHIQICDTYIYIENLSCHHTVKWRSMCQRVVRTAWREIRHAPTRGHKMQNHNLSFFFTQTHVF